MIRRCALIVIPLLMCLSLSDGAHPQAAKAVVPAAASPAVARHALDPGDRIAQNGFRPNAQPAEAFVDALGINVHLGYGDTAYKYATTAAPSGNSIVSSVEALGIHHIRDGGMDAAPSLCPAYRAIFEHGADVDAITTSATDAAALKKLVRCLGRGLFALEAPNELDRSGKPNWAQSDVAQMLLLRANRGITFPSSVKLFAPSATSEAAYVALAAAGSNLSKAGADYANAHVYLAAREPETAGWGGSDAYGDYGAITTTRNWAVEIASRGKPWASTETGYPDAPSDAGYVSEAVKAKYIARDVLRHWQDGAQYIYLYELAQENGSWGLMDENLYPKPAYRALRNIIAILADPGPIVASGYLKYTLAADPHVQQILFKKRDGSFWLCLWRNDASWDPDTNEPLDTPTSTVTISFGSVPRNLKIFALTPAGNVLVSAIKPALAISATITDTPSIIQIGTTTKIPALATLPGAIRARPTPVFGPAYERLNQASR